jgi:hypothetical protein
MRCNCRKLQAAAWRKREIARAALRHARIVMDPKILAYLNAEVQKRQRPLLSAPPSQFRR